MRIAQKYVDHNAETNAVANYLTDEAGGPSDAAARLNIGATQVTDLGALRTAHNDRFAEYIDPPTHANAIAFMATVDNEAMAFLRPLMQQIKHGAAAPNDDDYLNMPGLHRDKETRTPSERPTVSPIMVLIEARHLSHVYEAQVQDAESINRVALPPGTKLARELAVVAQGAEPTDDDFHALDWVGRGRFTQVFVPAEVGMVAHMRCCYVSTRGEKGPLSPALSNPIL